MTLDRLLISLYILTLMLGCCSPACAQLQPGDGRYSVQKQITSAQSNHNEKQLDRQITLYEAGQKLPALPGSTETIQVPVTGQATDSRGNTVTVQGTLTVTFESGSTPEPVPPGQTRCTAVLDAASGLVVTTAPSGTRLFLTGENLVPAEGQLYTVVMGGEKSTLLRGAEKVIEFRAPAVPLGKPNILVLYWLVNNNWMEKGRLPFEVTNTSPTPIPPEPPIPIPVPPDPNPPLQGENPRIDSISEGGGRVILTGAGFGAATGKVLLDNLPLQVVAWSEARIECLGPANTGNNVVVALWRPAYGWTSESWSPLP